MTVDMLLAVVGHYYGLISWMERNGERGHLHHRNEEIVIMCLWADDDDRFLLPLTDSLLFVKRDRNEERRERKKCVCIE